MSKIRVVGIREESPEEKALREWFGQQILASPTNLEEAARLLIGLVTGLLGVLFTVLAITNNPPPAYLAQPLVRELGALTVVFLLIALISSLVVVIPTRWTFNPAQPSSESRTFAALLQFKSRALVVAVISFGAGIVALAVVLILALLLPPLL